MGALYGLNQTGYSNTSMQKFGSDKLANWLRLGMAKIESMWFLKLCETILHLWWLSNFMTEV